MAVLGLPVIPLLNAALGQVPLDSIATVTKSAYAEMFGENRAGIASRLTSAAPFGLLETILSVHLVPGWIVNIKWTANLPMQWFFQWGSSNGVLPMGFFQWTVRERRRRRPFACKKPECPLWTFRRSIRKVTRRPLMA